jgi:glycosyltransferase involved in cell wall biosynthesis
MRLLGALYGRLDERGVRGADALLTLNSVTRDSIARTYGRTDARPVFAGIDHDHFHPFSEDQLADLRARHGEGPIAVHSTDFSPIKRTDLALAAFAAAGDAGAKLLITSTIDDKAGIERMWSQARELGVERQVEYLGFVDYEDLPRYYALADVLLQTGTSLNSGATSMSLPVKEGLACGTAVIRSRATDEDVEDGVSGYLVDPADSVAAGARIAELLGDREKASRFGAAGSARMIELYSWDRVVDAFEAAIEGGAT